MPKPFTPTNRFILVVFSLWFLVSGLIVISTGYYRSQILTRQLANNRQKIQEDFHKVFYNYVYQLQGLQNYLNKTAQPQKALEELWENKRLASQLNFSLVQGVLLIDRSNHLSFATIANKQVNTKIRQALPPRDYLERLRKSPNKTIYGEIVQGILSGVPSIPIATGLYNNKGHYQGALILSINLNSLTKLFQAEGLQEITIIKRETNEPSVEAAYSQQITLKSYIANLLTHKARLSDQIFFPSYHISFKYDFAAERQVFKQIIVFLELGWTLMVISMGLIIYNYIYRPLRPAFRLLNQTAGVVGIRANPFLQLSYAISGQVEMLGSYRLRLQQIEHLNHQQKYIILGLHSLILRSMEHFTDKNQCFAEEITDQLTLEMQEPYYQDLVANIKESLVKNQEDMEQLLDAMQAITQSTRYDQREEIELASYLVQLGFSPADILTENSKRFFYQVYPALLTKLILLIKEGQSASYQLEEVKLEENSLNFIFLVKRVNIIPAHMLKAADKFSLPTAQLLGLVNNIQLTQSYSTSEAGVKNMELTCHFTN